MHRVIGLFLLSSFMWASLALAKPFSKEQVPEPLKPWITWVAQDNPELNCPFLYNSIEQKRCTWPTLLALDLNAKKGGFVMRWQVFKDSWVSLPGDSQYWPLNVTVNGGTGLVLEKEGVPMIKLSATATKVANYEIKGEFLWDEIPENLSLPADTGLINLTLNGLSILLPSIKDGQLWLKNSESSLTKPENQQNNLSIQVFRKIIDDVPLQVQTRLVLDVSGEQREVKLASPLLQGFIPLQIQSPLPARLEPDGQLTVQIRPGQWQLDILARSSKNVDALAYPQTNPDWPSSEVWVFAAQPELRVVEIEQITSIDASQTTMPDEWRALPAYKINAGQAMGFKVIRRGDPEPEPNQLSLSRKLWLDFDGTGYTVNDTINGTMTHGWRLNSLAATQLGKVTLDGNNQLITQQASTNKQGVEVRKGLINLEADSRIIGAIDSMSAVGWEQTFHNVSAELNLPPGWRLLAASGVDNVPDSWVSRWTLLDLFVVLITALATARLWNYYWGALALFTLIILWHEAGAPQFVWLNILAATALLRVLPQSRFSQLARTYRNACWLALIIIVLPFMVTQVRMGIYPQLEFPEQTMQSYSQSPKKMLATLPAPMVAMEARDAAQRVEKAMLPEQVVNSYPAALDSGVLLERVDPKAKVQTGPGLPQWQWHQVSLTWNGAVDAEQQLHLWYLSPRLNLLLNVLRVVLVALLSLLMLDAVEKFKPQWSSLTPVLLAVLLLPALLVHAPKVYADYPSEALLNELKTRLQEVELPDCLPNCAQISQMAVSINDKTLSVRLQIHAQEAVSLPLPADYNQWFPNQVLDNGKAADALMRNEANLWIKLNKGEHTVILNGIAPLLGKFTLPLPLKPKYVTVEKSGWDIIGLQENGWTDEQLQFSRAQAPSETRKTDLELGTLPPFVRVERTLLLGLDWRVITQVSRISPADTAVVLDIPLLAGESVTTLGVRVKDNAVAVNMTAQQTTMQWESTLEKAPQIVLTAPETTQWIEVWKADISPIWHIEPTGIAMIHLNSEGQWLPEWHPWSNETITLPISRPPALEGQTLTIDSSRLQMTQGQRVQDVSLELSVRSSQGTQHTLTLPEKAVLQSVMVNGQSQPLRQQGQKLTVPINPGTQAIVINWQDSTTISPVLTTPTLDLGVASVNSNLSINLGQDRWPLFVTGPRLGPAILFWGVLVVLLMVSIGLGKITLTPLKHWQWFLLLVGLSQIPLAGAGVVIAWLIGLGWRKNHATLEWSYFNALQMSLAIFTALALAVLLGAVAQGLLNTPDMQITGNQSSAYNFNWYQDRSDALLPRATVISVPLIVYRLLMLAWALWLAVALLSWLKWGWGCFAANGLWHKTVKKAVVDLEPSQKDGI